MLTFLHCPAEDRGKLCRGHTISLGTSSVPASRNHAAGRESPTQPGYKETKVKPQVQGGVCQTKILGSGWSPGPEAVLKHLGPLHIMMREQASHFFVSLGPAMKSSLLQEVKIPPGYFWHVINSGGLCRFPMNVLHKQAVVWWEIGDEQYWRLPHPVCEKCCLHC